MKRTIACFAVFVLLLAPSHAAPRNNMTLIVAPARYTVMQVMFDVIAKRDAVLLSYQGEAGTANPLLHFWNGAAWTAIDIHELNELRFLTQTPDRAVLVGDDSLLPASVKSSLSWLPDIVTVTALDHAGLLNQLHDVFRWNSREWKWFSRRYNLNLSDENAEVRNRSWYDQSGPLRKSAPAPQSPAPAPVDNISPEPVIEAVPAEPAPVIQPEAAPAAPVEGVEETETKAEDGLDEVIQTLERERSKSDAAPVESYPIK